MLPFFILLIVPILIQHIEIKEIDYQKKNRFALFSFFVMLTVLVMLRHESIGNDTRNYMYYFERFSEKSWSEVGKSSFEIGFAYLNKIISLFSDNPQFFLIVTAILATAMIYPTYRRLCTDSSLTIVLFCIMSTFVMMFSGIRQMLAIGVGFIAYEFTRKKKLIPFIITVCVAVTFHTSAFMLIFMYPLYFAKITKKWLYIVVPALAIVFFFNKQIFSLLTLIMAQYTKYDGSISSTGAYTMLILFGLFTAFAFLIPDESIIDSETIGLRNMLLLSVIIQMFAPLHNLAMRMNYYYIIFIPLLLPKIMNYKSERWKQVAILGRHTMVAFFLVYFFINSYFYGKLNVFPYHFFWENV